MNEKIVKKMRWIDYFALKLIASSTLRAALPIRYPLSQCNIPICLSSKFL